MNNNCMNILITGASGFIGNKTFKFFKNKNYRVYVLQRNSNNKFYINKSLKIININQLDKINFKIDVIIHLSSKAHSSKFTNQDLNENYLLTNKLIKYAKRIKIKKFIFISSIKVNGEYSINNKISESSNPNPISIYAKSKYELEELIKKHFAKSSIEYYNIRIPLVIGEEVKGNLLSLIKLIKYNIPLPLKGITKKRSFISINDLLKIFETIINLKNDKSGLYLASNNKSLSVTNIYNQINKCFRKNNNSFYLNRNLLIFFFTIIGKKQNFIKLYNSLEIDNSKLIRELNFGSFSNIEEEIIKMVNSYKKKDA